MKDSGLSPQNSSRLRVEVPLWLSWLNTSVSKQSQAYIQLSTKYIKHIRDTNNKHKQDIKHKWERDEQWQTQENYFEIWAPLLYVPAFNTMKDFTIMIPQDHSMPQYLQRIHTRTLRPASPSLVLARTIHTSTLACRGRTSYNSSNHKLEYLVITLLDHHKTLFTEATTSTLLTIQEWILMITFLDHKNNSHNKDPKRIDIAMKSSNFCEKNKIDLW